MVLIVGALAGSSCIGPSTPARLPAYLDVHSESLSGETPFNIPPHGFSIGLVMINDTTHTQSAPALARPVLNGLADRLVKELQKKFSLTINAVRFPQQLAPGHGVEQFIHLAQEMKEPLLFVAVLSGSDVEVPVHLPVSGMVTGGYGPATALGYRLENYALDEMVLLDGATGDPLISIQGQAWATLYDLTIPIQSNVYPVIKRSQRFPRIYPTEKTAHDTLRYVSAEEAMDEALMHLQEKWKSFTATEPNKELM